MIRVILTQVLLFLLPFIGFLFYRFVTEGWAGVKVTDWTRVRFGLVLAGAVLALAGIIYFALTGGEESGVYVPAQYRDGELVPGYFRQP